MREDFKELDKLLSNIATRGTTKEDLNILKDILIKHLNNLGGPLTLPLEDLNLKLEDLDLELEPLNIDLDEGLIIDPYHKKESKK